MNKGNDSAVEDISVQKLVISVSWSTICQIVLWEPKSFFAREALITGEGWQENLGEIDKNGEIHCYAD